MELKFHINLLKISYIFHFILLILIIFFNVLYKINIIWITSILNNLFLVCIIILVLVAISPIILFIILFIKNTYKIIFSFLKISLGLTFISIMISIGIIIIFYNINISYHAFYKNCPFNFDSSDIEIIFTDYINNKNIIDNNKLLELKEKCENRRCIQHYYLYDSYNSYNSDIYQYSYICNYNSAEDFKDDSHNIICEKFILKDILESQAMHSYINLCNSLVDFYFCKTTENYEKYNIKYNYICPKEKKKSIIAEIIISFLNIVIPVAIFIIQFFYYKKILKLIVTRNIHRSGTENENGNGGTVDTSKKSELNKDNNNSFKKEHTELIIVEHEKNEDELSNIYNKDKSKRKNNRSISNIKAEFIQDKITMNPIISNEIIKINKKNKDKKLTIEVDVKNRSFSNINNNYMNDNKIDLLDSKRRLSDNSEYNKKYELNKKNNENITTDKMKCLLLIKK